MTDELRSVLLAAGRGSRLQPLTNFAPKPMLPIDGVAVIERVIRQVRSNGIDDSTIIVGHRCEQLRTFVESLADTGRCEFVEQAEQNGSAHALQCAIESGMPLSDAFVAATDTWWTDEDVTAVINRFRAERPMVAMGLRRWPLEQLPHRSCVVLDEDMHVRTVLEKPDLETLVADNANESTALSGSPIYVFRSDFWPYVESVRPSPNGMFELAAALQRAIGDGHTILGIEVSDTRDITRPEDLLLHNFPYLRHAAQ
jgi:glucose-1-phosphate thymidylyltransferase